jgi:DnaJ-class molecular chaperone
MRKECPTCLGLGLIPVLTPPMPCPDCHGLGYVEIEDEPEPMACFCGNTNLQIFHTVLDGWQVYCPNCGDKTEGDVDREEAINWWNHLHDH